MNTILSLPLSSLTILQCVFGSYHLLNGGKQYDCSDISSVNEEEVKAVVKKIYADGIRNIVVLGIFSSVDQSQETLV